MYSLFKHLWCSEIPLGRIREAEVSILEFFVVTFKETRWSLTCVYCAYYLFRITAAYSLDDTCFSAPLVQWPRSAYASF